MRRDFKWVAELKEKPKDIMQASWSECRKKLHTLGTIEGSTSHVIKEIMDKINTAASMTNG